MLRAWTYWMIGGMRAFWADMKRVTGSVVSLRDERRVREAGAREDKDRMSLSSLFVFSMKNPSP